jgi:hypothetical protein
MHVPVPFLAGFQNHVPMPVPVPFLAGFQNRVPVPVPFLPENARAHVPLAHVPVPTCPIKYHGFKIVYIMKQ